MYQTLNTVFAASAAIILYQTATLLIGGHIFKEALTGFYDAFPEWWQRMLIVIIPLSGVGNLLATYAFQNPIVAGITFLVLGLWSPLMISSIVDSTHYGLGDLALVAAISVLGLMLGFRLS